MNTTSPNSLPLHRLWTVWLRRFWMEVLTQAEKPPRVLEARVSLSGERPVAQVDERYLSFSLDISVVAGGFWWEGAMGSRGGLGRLRIPPLDLNSTKLDKLTQALAPAYLRVGGSEADRVHYFSAPADEPHSLVLTQAIWDRLHGFLQRNQLRFFFTVKYGLFERRQHGQWQGGEVEKLLQYSRERGYTIDVCELGNELNAYWAFHGLRSQPRAFKLAVDYHTFSKIIQRQLPKARITGPGSAFWPKLGETIKPFSNITKKFLETCQQNQTPLQIVDWHYYPFQSLRSPIRTRTATLTSLLKPHALNDFKKYSAQLRAWRDQFYPVAELWTGETGSAQCGGQPKLSDRFISCFWWADQLGQGGLNDQKVMIRQCLIGGEYGLIDRLTLKPRPDYWLSWLWKRLMGTQVFAVSSPHHMLRCYCHDTPSNGDKLPAGGCKTLLIINLSARPFHLHPTGFGRLVQQYALTAKKLTSKKVRINSKKVRFAGGNFRLEDYVPTELTHEIPGHSIHFWLYHSAAAE